MRTYLMAGFENLATSHAYVIISTCPGGSGSVKRDLLYDHFEDLFCTNVVRRAVAVDASFHAELETTSTVPSILIGTLLEHA